MEEGPELSVPSVEAEDCLHQFYFELSGSLRVLAQFRGSQTRSLRLTVLGTQLVQLRQEHEKLQVVLRALVLFELKLLL